MQLSISNIIWKKGKENFESFLKLLSLNGVYAIELSLNSIFEEPLEMTENDMSWIKSLLKKYGISISSLHSLTYTRPDLELFNTNKKRKELLSYLLNYIDIARKLNVKNIVYGSPKSRKLYSYNQIEANNIFIEFIREIDSYSNDINFNIEPLPVLYCEYLNTFQETVNLLEDKNFKNIFVQLDIRSVIESNENINNIFKNSKYIKHVHIGEPNLLMPSKKYANLHILINKMLQKIPYKGYLSIEVLNHEQKKFEEYSLLTIKNVKEYYGK